MTEVSSEIQEKEKRNWLSLTTYCKTSAPLFCKVMQCEAISAGVGRCPSDRLVRKESTYCTSTVLWDQSWWSEINTWSLSVNLSYRKRQKNAVNILSPLWLRRSFFISLWFAGSALSVLLVMLIVSRPPAECDPFPVGWLWSCLPKEMSLCVPLCVCVYSAQLQCVTKALAMLHTCACVWLCVSGCISTDLHAPATVRRDVFPILQTLRVKTESSVMFHLNAAIYWLFLLFILSAFDPISKAKPVGTERHFSHFFFPSGLHPMDFWESKWPCPMTEGIVKE